jgi:hypothetical protein
MALAFPNISRSFDSRTGSVRFWGYDSTFEITFYVGSDALHHIKPEAATGEDGLLLAFDTNRTRIERAAASAYDPRRRQDYHLSVADFG